MLKTQTPGLFIMNSENKGRGVFTTSPIIKESIIEICPVIVLSTSDTRQIHETLLHDYYFLWDLEKKTSALALGYGSLYNHSDQPNAIFDLDYDGLNIKFAAIRDIKAGDEITVDYIAAKEEGYKLWF